MILKREREGGGLSTWKGSFFSKEGITLAVRGGAFFHIMGFLRICERSWGEGLRKKEGEKRFFTKLFLKK